MTILEQMLEDTKSVAILGHIRPDGDCLGSTLGLYNYLRLNYPDIRAAVYLEESSPKFSYLKGYDTIRHQVDGECYELCVCMDSGDIQRLGDFKHYLDQADKSLCLDHHVTNTRYGGTNVVPDEASSTCEVLFDQLDEGKLDRYTAECLYTGIIHDTGVFKFSCTSAHTMEIAGKLMGKGIDFGAIIDNSFYRKHTSRTRFWAELFWRASPFLTDGASSAPSARARWSFTGLTARIWTASLTSCALRKAWKLPFSSMRQDLRNLRSACAPSIWWT